jgi:uncharacterized membrane protein
MNLQDMFPGIAASENLHPVFVHLPLGVWPVAFMFFVLGVVRNSDRLLEVGRWLLYFATAGAVVAATSGWLASEGLGHDTPGHDLVHVHRDWMLIATGLSILTSGMAFAFRRSENRAKAYAVLATFALTLGVSVLGADRGAYLVFGHGVGVSSAIDAEPHDGDAHEH